MEYWKDHQDELSKAILQKTIGLNELMKERDFFLENEKKFRLLYAEYLHYISSQPVVIGKMSKRVKEIKHMAEEMRVKIYVCCMSLNKLNSDIEKLNDILIELKSYRM